MREMIKQVLVAFLAATIIAVAFRISGVTSTFAFLWGLLLVLTIPLVVAISLRKTSPLAATILTLVTLGIVIYQLWPAVSLYRARLIGPKTEMALAEQRLDLDQKRYDALHPTGRVFREDVSEHAGLREATVTAWGRKELQSIRERQAQGQLTEAEVEQLEQQVIRDKRANLLQVEKLKLDMVEPKEDEGQRATGSGWRRYSRYLQGSYLWALVAALVLILFALPGKRDEKTGRRATDKPATATATTPATTTVTTTAART